jgi:hypothetical protein
VAGETSQSIGALSAFLFAIPGPPWPEPRPPRQSKHFSHILVVSDTQIKNPALATSWTFDRLLFDLHLKKSWHFAMHFKPHHVIFLGDMTASGRGALSDEECVPFI